MATTDTQITRTRKNQISMDKKSMQSLLIRSIAVLLIASSLVGISGCTMTAKESQIVVEPNLLREAAIEGIIQTSDSPADSVSPNGSYFLAVNDNASGSHLIVMPVDDEDAKAITVESVSKDWLSDSWFSYRPLGWTSDTEFVYAKMGWQPTGTHKGERGVTLAFGRLPGDSGKPQLEVSEGPAIKASTEEVAFFTLPYRDSSLRTLFLPKENKVYLNNNTTIWQFNIAEKNLTVLKSGLPDYIYRQPIASPKGGYFVYELNEKDKNGIFIFDTATLEERPLIPNGDTMSFYPAWSFDGKYIAAYTVGKKEGATGTSWHDYRLFEGEDTAQSVGSSITVVDTEGAIVDTIRIDGKYLQNFRWAKNNHTIGFVAGSNLEDQSSKTDVQPRSVTSESVWLVRIGGSSRQTENPAHLGDILKDNDNRPPYTWLVAFSTDTEGIFCNVYHNGTWYFSENTEPVKITDGLWPGLDAEIAPVYGDSVVALIDKEQSRKEFYLFNGVKTAKFGDSESLWAWVVAYTDNKLVLFCGEIDEDAEEGSAGYSAYPTKGRLAVYNMVKP